MTEYVLPDAAWKKSFRRQVNAWYARHARDLPWRRTRDPYHVWISEIMLQQTQVATVIPYFERFITAFPNIAKLASASEPEVLRLWEGLGYYRRARQLHKAAQRIAERHDSEFPDDLASVSALPGIGRYTRGAILSIAFDQRQPILEANTIRLHCRLLAYDGDHSTAAGQTLLWRFAEDVLPRKNPGQFNQALMEIGGAVCTPKEPKCLICPVVSICPTRAQGLQAEIPRPKKKMQYVELAETAVVVCKGPFVLLRRCQNGERWAGLWDFPRCETPPGRRAKIADKVAELTGVQCQIQETLATIKHGVTKYRITLRCERADYVGGRRKRNAATAWVKIASLSDYPLSVTGRKIARMLETKGARREARGARA